ncbi:MAG: large subunit ribosomal protein [Candidatus Woesearchaeota archaeon]|nr:large subunit ribosomal protein [Candidatus Woesearchaeota archaeon]
MAEKSVEVLVEGGKATAAPPLGPALGPLGVNIGQVVAEINKKTAGFKGMQVPVKVVVDEKTKEFSISVGTPPSSELIKKEVGIAKGAANPKEKVADISLEGIKKIVEMKQDSLLGKDMKAKVKEIVGTCRSMGVYVEGKIGDDFIKELNEGKYDDKF